MGLEMTYYNTLFRAVPCRRVIVPCCVFCSALSSAGEGFVESELFIISLREESP